MQAVMKRLAQLEASASPSGLLLQAWWCDQNGAATTSVGGREHVQSACEDLQTFLTRVSALELPSRPVLWVSEVDARL